MSENREGRYPSAEGVADDVVRFLDGNPVSAYRENVFEKAGRWLNKNRFIVLLIRHPDYAANSILLRALTNVSGRLIE
jgi:hypothetical protein